MLALGLTTGVEIGFTTICCVAAPEHTPVPHVNVYVVVVLGLTCIDCVTAPVLQLYVEVQLLAVKVAV